MTSSGPATGRAPRRRWWPALAGVVGTVAVLVAVQAGFAASSDDSRPRPATTPSAAPAAPETPSEAPDARAVAAMAESAPTRLRIPAIGVDSKLMALGLQDDGTLETPPGPFPAGWFTGAPTPGELGPAIIAGHVRYEKPGVFARLSELSQGELIRVDRRDGSTATFRIVQIDHFAKSAFPSKLVYGNLDHPGLRLITCGGLDADTNVFEENVVVFADLVA